MPGGLGFRKGRRQKVFSDWNEEVGEVASVKIPKDRWGTLHWRVVVRTAVTGGSPDLLQQEALTTAKSGGEEAYTEEPAFGKVSKKIENCL